MLLKAKLLLQSAIFWIVTCVILGMSPLQDTQERPESVKDFCLSETFEPHCEKNEVVHIRRAVYGRMRVGRCLSSEEVDAHRSVAGDDPRYFGCSSDVLRLFARQCSGKADCRIRVFDISQENVKPCFPGLSVYLEVSYDCIGIVDEKRSCAVTVSEIPSHIIGSSGLGQQLNRCGTRSQPWTVEAPIGQRVGIGVLHFTSSDSGNGNFKQCENSREDNGIIIDKVGKRNSSICFDETKNEEEIFVSAGNTVDIIFFSSNQQKERGQFLLRLQAVGCSDLIPPEDAWMKRNEDTIVIGCYSSRQTWHLSCQKGKWSGVLGNCSQDLPHDSEEKEGQTPTLSYNGRILGVFVIVGFTLILCLTIVCVGTIYLRKFYVDSKERRCRLVRPDHCDVRSVERCQEEDQWVGGLSTGGTVRDPAQYTLVSHPQMLTYSV